MSRKLLMIALGLNFFMLTPCLYAADTCTPIRYSFSNITQGILSYASVLYLGNTAYNYQSPNIDNWAMPTLSGSLLNIDTFTTAGNPDNSYPWREAGYVMVSNDCGQTWTRSNEYVPPLNIDQLDPSNPNDLGYIQGNLASAGLSTTNPTNIANYAAFLSVTDGVNHYASSTTQGFVSGVRWRGILTTSQIYAVHPQTVGQNNFNYDSYSLPANYTKPNPVIGYNTLNPNFANDNFYAPSFIVDPVNSTKTQLFFGGWRANYVNKNASPLRVCNGDIQSAGDGYIDENCTCNTSNALDSCTGDKIFMATNRFANAVADDGSQYSVYRPSDNTYTNNNQGTQNFEPVISPALFNTTCHVTDLTDCPFPLVHTNDPSVVSYTNNGVSEEIMYFSGAPGPASVNGPDYTHVAISTNNGQTWGNFKILTAAPGVRFPGGLPFNQSNGLVRAFLVTETPAGQTTGSPTIYLVSTPDNRNNPNFNNADNDTTAMFLYKINPNNPNVVMSAQKISENSSTTQTIGGLAYDVSQCSSTSTTCGAVAKTFTPSAAVPEISPSKLPDYQKILVDGYTLNQNVVIGSIADFQNISNNYPNLSSYATTCANFSIATYNDLSTTGWSPSLLSQNVNQIYACQTNLNANGVPLSAFTNLNNATKTIYSPVGIIPPITLMPPVSNPCIPPANATSNYQLPVVCIASPTPPKPAPVHTPAPSPTPVTVNSTPSTSSGSGSSNSDPWAGGQ